MAGSDTSGNGSLDAPFATVTRGVAAADPGDHVVLRGGTYAGPVTVTEPDITIRSHDGEWAILSAPYDSTSVYQTVRVHTGADRLTLSRLEITGGYYYTIKTETTADDGRGDAATGLTIQDCKLHDSGRDVIKLVPGSDGATIRRNEIYNSGRRDASNADGIDNVNADRMTVQDNHIHHIATSGLYPKGGATGAIVERNLITDCGVTGVAVGFFTDTEFFDTVANPGYYESIDTVVRNNVIARTQYAGVGLYASRGARVYNNTLVDTALAGQAAVLLSSADHYIGGQSVYQRNLDPVVVNNVVVQSAGTRPMVELRADSLDGPAVFGNNVYHRVGGVATFRDLSASTSVGAVEFAGWRAAGYDGGSREADPLLDGSYHLWAGSPAVDAGRAMLELGVDYDGNVRTGIPDIGADEFGAGQILTAPPPSGVVGTGALPAIESVVINAGSVQRSTVTEITITFDTEVDTSLLATAFSLTRTTDGVTVGAIAVTTEMSAGRRTVARLTFTGASTRAGSLDDGRWTLTVDHSKVRAGAGSEMAADFGLQLHRLFGDSNGDGDVDNGDLLQFRSTFGKTATQSGYASHFDIDQDGDIDNGDLLQFRYRFGQQV